MLITRLLLVLFLTILGCDRFQLPQLVRDPAPPSRLPISVTLDFDDSITSAQLEAQACDALWQGHLGHALVTSFLQAGQQSFAQVGTESVPAPGGATNATPSDIRIRLTLEQQSFEPISVFGDEDTYRARLQVQLMAVVADPQGNPIGKTPLRYDERINMWVPELSSSSAECATEQLEQAMKSAADDLARQMVAAIGQWAGGPRAPGAAPAYSGAPVPAPQAGMIGAAVAVKATLLDENDNQILEAGEKIGVRVDATNGGQAPVPSASVTLSGTTTLIDAFTSTAGAPPDLGPLQPGETKSTIVWGKMPDTLESQRGELVVSVIAAGASTSQTLVAAIRPRDRSGAAVSEAGSSTAGQVPEASARSVSGSPNADRHAVLINVTTYRTPWAETHATRSEKFPHLIRVLRTEGGLSRERMLVLSDRGATRADLEEGLLRWLPAKVTTNSIVLVYISTQAVADEKTGEIYLIPYEGTPKASQRSLVSLMALQGTLKRINAKLCLLLVDAPLTTNAASKARTNWQGLIDPAARSSGRLVQIVSSNGSLRLDRMLVLALSGQADANRDKQVTLGEVLDYLEVGAQIYPTLPASAPERSIPLTG